MGIDDNTKEYINAANDIYISFGRQLAHGEAKLSSIDTSVAKLADELRIVSDYVKRDIELKEKTEERIAQSRSKTSDFMLKAVGPSVTMIFTIVALSLAKGCGVDGIIGSFVNNGK